MIFHLIKTYNTVIFCILSYYYVKTDKIFYLDYNKITS